MARIIIQADLHDRYQWIMSDTQGPTSPVQQGNLDDLASTAKGVPATVILPGAQTLFTQATVPTRNRQRILQALPYALEDQFVDDIEKLHFAIPSSIKTSDAIPVCAVSRDFLGHQLETLKTAGIEVQQVYSSIQCLPYSEDQWTVFLEDELVSIRISASAGFTLDSLNFSDALRLALSDEKLQSPERITVLDGRSGDELEPLQLPEELSDIPVDTKPSSEPALALYASNLEQAAINLLQGPFAQKKKRQLLSRRWLPAAVVFLALLGLQLTSSILEYGKLRKQTTAQQKTIEQLFKQALPDARKMTGFKPRMQQRLKELKQQSAGSETDFLQLLASSGTIFRQYGSLKLTGIQYRRGMLDIELTIRDLQTLEALKQNLSRTGLIVDIRNANVSGNRVTGRLQLKGAS